MSLAFFPSWPFDTIAVPNSPLAVVTLHLGTASGHWVMSRKFVCHELPV